MVAEPNLLKVGATVQHYRNGKQYRVLGTAYHTETLEKMVVYQALHDDPKFGDQALWARPESMFLEMVEHDGQMVPRFLPVHLQ
jgi:hypothetical protein